jgi:hypothetical protein
MNMTEPREPTLKQWKRRALAAEERADFLQTLRAGEAAKELQLARETARLRVALKEIQEVITWALEQKT